MKDSKTQKSPAKFYKYLNENTLVEIKWESN